MPPNRMPKNKLPSPLPEGLILTDTSRKCWRLGKTIGQGGFGLLYLASPECNKPVTEDALHVIKVEYYQNGPLFCELKFYQRAVKDEEMEKWISKHRLDYLGIPKYWGSGEITHLSTSYRFMVIDRLGVDLQKLLVSNSGRFPLRTIMQLGIRLLDVLEFIHQQEYAHGDIKAANVLLHYTDPSKVYLADYGLSYRYCPNGNHKEYKENPRKGPNGTIEFTSLDAHRGAVPSRRGDLQILAFCMLHWLCGKLPWDQNLKDPTAVHASKKKLLDELPQSVIEWTAGVDGCYEIAEFMADVNCLAYTEKPNYGGLKKILLKGLEFTATSLSAPLTFSQLRLIFKDPKTVKHACSTWQINPGIPSPVHDQKGAEPTKLPKHPKASKKINAAEMHVLKDNDMNDINNGSHRQPCALQKRLPRDLCSHVSITEPKGTVNVQVVQHYTFPKTKRPVRFQNGVCDNQSSQIEQENHHKDRENIYKYSLIIPVLLIMIFIALYVV